MMSVSSSGSASGSAGYGSSSRSIGYESMLVAKAYESHVATVGVKGRSNSSMQVVGGDRYICEFFEKVLCCKSINGNQNFIPMDMKSSFWKNIVITLNDMNIKSDGIICKLLEAIERNLSSVKLNIGHIDHYKNLNFEKSSLKKTIEDEECVCLYFDEDSVKEEMEQEKIFLRKNGENCCCIEKMSYAQLFDLPLGSEELLYTCAAFFLFHELYHLNSFAMHKFDEEHGYEKANRDLSVCKASLKDIKILFTDNGILKESGDDARNTIWNLYVPRENPGEFELLNALCHTPTIRLYYGASLDFKISCVQNACINVMIGAFTEPALIKYTDSSKIDFKDYTSPQLLTEANLKTFLFEQSRIK